MTSPYRILERKRSGDELAPEDIRTVVHGAAAKEETDARWSDAQLAAFLTSAVIHGLSDRETEALTVAMLESGERWYLEREIPHLADKHSTGGVGDKVSILLAPLLAACGVPVVMLTGRGLGHTGGTADKLESIPGMRQDLDKQACLDLLDDPRIGMALGVATSRVATADQRLYALRGETATVESVPLITGSILSKKLAAGARGLVFDVKTGNGAFMADPEDARELAQHLVDVATALGQPTRALVTDMSQPLGRWVGHAAEVREVWEMLGGDPGPEDLRTVTFRLCREVAGLVDVDLSDEDLTGALASGRARERFVAWAARQGAERAWLDAPSFDLAPDEHVLTAPRAGFVARVETRQMGLLLAETGGGRRRAGDAIDFGVSLHVRARLGDAVEAGQELGRLHLRHRDEAVAQAFADCFEIGDGGTAPPLIRQRVAPSR